MYCRTPERACVRQMARGGTHRIPRAQNCRAGVDFRFLLSASISQAAACRRSVARMPVLLVPQPRLYACSLRRCCALPRVSLLPRVTRCSSLTRQRRQQCRACLSAAPAALVQTPRPSNSLSPAGRAALFTGAYIAAVGAVLLVAPAQAMLLLFSSPPPDCWTRVFGVLCLTFASY